MVQITFTDQIEKKRYGWYLNEAGRCELCLTPPTDDVDLYLECTLPDLIYIWRGDLTLARAQETGRLTAHGTGRATRALADWLTVSSLAGVASVRADARPV